MVILTYNKRNNNFWKTMGFYFADKEVRKELPYIIDEKEKIWIIGYENRKVVGFLSYKSSGNAFIISNCYTDKYFREQGKFKELMDYTLEKLKYEKKIKLVILQDYINFFKRRGFYEGYKKGEYITMIKENN